MENNSFTLGVLTDISKELGTVGHQVFTSKFENYWVKGNNLNWFKSYLKNRKQYLTFNNNATAFAQLKCSIPQWSIFSLLFFLFNLMISIMHQIYWTLLCLQIILITMSPHFIRNSLSILHIVSHMWTMPILHRPVLIDPNI